jgi:hypothetical protein
MRAGKFTLKANEPREVRSIRLTRLTWKILGEIAHQRGITRADLMENLVEIGVISQESFQDLSPTRRRMLAEMEQAMNSILDDPKVTRNGFDAGAVRRAFEALQRVLSSSIR